MGQGGEIVAPDVGDGIDVGVTHHLPNSLGCVADAADKTPVLIMLAADKLVAAIGDHVNRMWIVVADLVDAPRVGHLLLPFNVLEVVPLAPGLLLKTRGP